MTAKTTLSGHLGSVTKLVFESNDVLYSSSWDRTVRQWHLGSAVVTSTMVSKKVGMKSKNFILIDV